jgi:hypothetical protein
LDQVEYKKRLLRYTLKNAEKKRLHRSCLLQAGRSQKINKFLPSGRLRGIYEKL